VAKPQFEWGIAPSPYGPGGKNTMQREDNAWYVGQGSKNPDAGFQLILFTSRGVGADDLITFAEDNPPLSDPSYAQKWSSGILKIPGFSMTQQAFVSVFEGGVQAGRTDPAAVVADYSEFGNAFTQIMAPVWLGNQTPLDGLQAVQQKWEGIIAASQKQS
jgi:ABC-type glycerol-3-phosphate transport system substrate-binding protein